MMCDFILVTLVVAGMRANPIFVLGIGVGLPWNHVGCKQPNICELGGNKLWMVGEVFWQSVEPTTHNHPW